MIWAAMGITLVVAAGVGLATYAYDRGQPHWRSRKLAHIGGGVGYLLAVLFMDAPSATALSGASTLLLIALRVRTPGLLRGVGGSARAHAYAELSYPLAGTLSLGVGWWLLGDPWLALVPIWFMAFGDAITGLVRSLLVRQEQKHLLGSAAMLAVSLPIALLYQPYWIGAVGAVTATVVERLSPLARGIWDDNSLIILSSLGVMAALTHL